MDAKKEIDLFYTCTICMFMIVLSLLSLYNMPINYNAYIIYKASSIVFSMICIIILLLSKSNMIKFMLLLMSLSSILLMRFVTVP